MVRIKTIIILCILFLFACEEGPSPSIEFYLGESLIVSMDVSEMKERWETHKVGLYDVEYRKNKDFRAFIFNDILESIYGDDLQSADWTSISFTALDGYNAVMDLHKFDSPSSYLVFEDEGYENWEPLPDHGTETAGPFYLVWKEQEQVPKNGFSWPWGIKEIALVKLSEEYTFATPDSLQSSLVLNGYTKYMSRCNSCHALNGQGGQIGPDLNDPMNILDYRSEEMVRAFITEPSRFRKGRMPDFKDLTTGEVDELIAYLYYIKNKEI